MQGMVIDATSICAKNRSGKQMININKHGENK